jgi:hypothetical protein
MSKPKFIISTTGTSTATNIRRNIFSPPINEKGIKKEIQGCLIEYPIKTQKGFYCKKEGAYRRTKKDTQAVSLGFKAYARGIP